MANNGNSLVCPISEDFELAEADDIDRSAGAGGVDITGALRLLIKVAADGTLGTAGIDAVQYSFDGGNEWEDATDLRTIEAADDSTAISGGVLNAAGVEPTGEKWFKAGPFYGPTMVRVITDTDWVTGAPSVDAQVIGISRDALTAATA
jgi:hypothetical protein